MKFIVEMTHKKTGEKKYVGAVQLPAGTLGSSVEKGLPVTDSEIAIFATLAGAGDHPFPTAEAAAMVLGTFPQTTNIDYRVIDAEAQTAAAGV
jgi:hypothetical protein